MSCFRRYWSWIDDDNDDGENDGDDNDDEYDGDDDNDEYDDDDDDDDNLSIQVGSDDDQRYFKSV